MRAWIWLLLFLYSAPAWADSPAVLVRHGGGYLIADGTSVIPLMMTRPSDQNAPGFSSVKVSAKYGKIVSSRVLDANRVVFYYAVPARKKQLEEVIEADLTLADGASQVETFTLVLREPDPVSVALVLAPKNMDARGRGKIRFEVEATGEGMEGLQLRSDRATILESPVRTGSGMSMGGEQTPPSMPPDAPSYLMYLAAASGRYGFGIATDGVGTTAPVRLSMVLEPGTKMVVVGAENDPPPVTAPADGKTVMEGVQVRYGNRIQVFEEGPGGRRELSVALPTGAVPLGMAMGLPGQTFADGGTGPSIVVAIPPSPMGGQIFWPDVQVEGAQLVTTQDLSPTVKILVLKRPLDAKSVRVLLDDQEVGNIEFAGTRGTQLSVVAAAPQRDERGAVNIEVRDYVGNLTDFPLPRVRLEKGGELKLKRQSTGTYRAVVVPGGAGKAGEKATVVVELEPAPLIAGDAAEFVRATETITLAGQAPTIKADPPPVVKKPAPAPATEKLKLGVTARAMGATAFGSYLLFGAAAHVEARLPFWENRFAIRSGFELMVGSAKGNVTIDVGTTLPATARVGGFLLPLEAGFAVLRTPSFELLVRAGMALRIESGALEVGGDNVGGSQRVGFGIRSGLDTAMVVGPGDILLGVTLDGLGASAAGLAAPGSSLDGSLAQIRAELGYRLWF